MSDAEPVVRVVDVFVGFRGAAEPVMALRGADLTLGRGERLLVQGPNGSGKSTLLRVVTGDQPVLAGRVEVGGAAVHAMDPAARRRWRTRAVGSLDQYARRNLLPELDVTDNVALQLRLTGTSAAEARRTAAATLARLGLQHLADRDVSSLSGGEAQRVATCAAVAHGPSLLLADEPTGELDDAAARTVYDLLEAVAADGTGVILVSHDARAVRFVDRAVRLRDGRLAEQWFPDAPDVVTRVPDSRGWVWRPEATADPAPAPPPRRGPVATTEPLVRALGVRGGYGERTLFSALDLDLSPGSWTVVSGPSGAGKSTLLGLVCGLVDPLAGAVEVGGTAWGGLDRASRASHRRRWVAVSPQRPSLVETMTVRENWRLTGSVRGTTLDDAVVGTTATALGLEAVLDQPAAVLSGGERQRASLGRTLVSGAPVLVVDEPTSQQDDVSADRVRDALLGALAQGRTVLVASHDPRLLAEADQHVRLDPDAPSGFGLSSPGPRPARAAGPPGTATRT